MRAHVRIEDGKPLYQGVFTCPHCGREHRHWFPVWARPEVFLCETEEGGCDGYFVITSEVDVTVNVASWKIEGISPDAPEEVDA